MSDFLRLSSQIIIEIGIFFLILRDQELLRLDLTTKTVRTISLFPGRRVPNEILL